jgi:hypothetical protein
MEAGRDDDVAPTLAQVREAAGLLRPSPAPTATPT